MKRKNLLGKVKVGDLMDTLREPLLVLDGNLCVISANRSFLTIFKINKKGIEGRCVYDLDDGQWEIPKLRILLEDIVPKNSFFEDFNVRHSFSKIGTKIMILNARRIGILGGTDLITLLAIEDVTRQKQLEDQLKDYTKRLSLEVEKKTAKLEVRVKELERINKVMIGREMKMIQLKAELKKLKKSR